VGLRCSRRHYAPAPVKSWRRPRLTAWPRRKRAGRTPDPACAPPPASTGEHWIQASRVRQPSSYEPAVRRSTGSARLPVGHPADQACANKADIAGESQLGSSRGVMSGGAAVWRHGRALRQGWSLAAALHCCPVPSRRAGSRWWSGAGKAPPGRAETRGWGGRRPGDCAEIRPEPPRPW
jgi:hypothetical protein